MKCQWFDIISEIVLTTVISVLAMVIMILIVIATIIVSHLQDSCSFAASVRDYRHYLDSTPTPSDAPQVKLELEKVQRARKAELKGDLCTI